jgi:hypothetical protein
MFLPNISAKTFMLAYTTVQYHPKRDDCERVLIVNGQERGVNYDYYRRYIRPVAYALADVIDEILAQRRWDPMNHVPHFPSHFTEMYDSFPVKVCEPCDPELAGTLRQPKYKACVFKITLGVTFLGEITAYATLSLGIEHDGSIALREEGREFHERLPGEWSLGDGVYEVWDRCLCKHRPQQVSTNPPVFAPLTLDQEQDNYLYDFYRARVEQVNTQCVYSHEMFHGRPFLGSFHDLRAYADITINASALLIREFEPSRQRQGFGPLPHFPAF